MAHARLPPNHPGIGSVTLPPRAPTPRMQTPGLGKARPPDQCLEAPILVESPLEIGASHLMLLLSAPAAGMEVRRMDIEGLVVGS